VHRRRHGRCRPVRGGAVGGEQLRYPFLRNDPDGDIDIEIAVDGLRFVNEAGPSGALPFSEIREVRLFCGGAEAWPFAGPGRLPTFTYYCAIRLASGDRLLLTDVFREADGQWISYSPRYQAFILALHEYLCASGTRIRYRAGLSWVGFLWRDAFWGNWVQVGIAESQRDRTSFLTRGFFRTLFRNWPRRYRPEKPPERFLPPV
jgi:hypothetical protein